MSGFDRTGPSRQAVRVPATRQISVPQAEAFLAVAEHRSVSAAAKALGQSQSALSRAMQRAEAAVGASLFERLPVGVQLTVSGQRYLQRARELVRLHAEACTAMAAWRPAATANLSVAGDGSVLHAAGAALLSRMAAAFPASHLTLLETAGAEVLTQVLAGRHSVGITVGAGEQPNLHYTLVLKADLGLLVSAQSPVQAPLSTVDDLRGLALLRLSDANPVTQMLERSGQALGRYSDGALSVNTVALGKAIVQRGGYAMAASGLDAVSAEVQGLRFIAMPHLPKLSVFLVTRRIDVFDERRALFRDVLREAIHAAPWPDGVARLGSSGKAQVRPQPGVAPPSIDTPCAALKISPCKHGQSGSNDT